MSCVLMLQRGHSGDGCVLASTLCKYDFRNGDLFVLSWARVRRVRRGSLSSELLMCGGGVRSILLLPLVARCLETIDVCIWRMFVFVSVVVTVWGSVGMFVVFSLVIIIVMSSNYFFHGSVHCFPTSLNIIRSSKEQECASWEHCKMCVIVSSAEKLAGCTLDKKPRLDFRHLAAGI